MRDYEQKSEILWNEGSQIKTQHIAFFKMIKSHFDKKRKKMQFQRAGIGPEILALKY